MLGLQAPATDLLLPLPEPGEVWDPHTIHTHYFGVNVPGAAIGAYFYIRYMPAFPLCQGGVVIFQGLNNLSTTDAVFHDYELTMPWPDIAGNRITTANGLTITFDEPGSQARVSYRSTDGRTRVEVDARAVTPLAARGHVIPGEELHTSAASGGSEQFMHCTGELVVHGARHEVDCVTPRDRSWRQVRLESRDANLHPPVSWTPIYFGEDLAFNQVGMEAMDTDPAWTGLYELPPGAPSHHFAWISAGGEVRTVSKVRRSVTRLHPLLFAPLAMTIDAEDETGAQHRFEGEAVALCPVMMWPNIAAFDSLYRWRDGTGRTVHSTVQTMHVEAFAQQMKSRRAPLIDDLLASLA